eukprot:1186698-Prorocentrum_minimum.AAC.2
MNCHWAVCSVWLAQHGITSFQALATCTSEELVCAGKPPDSRLRNKSTPPSDAKGSSPRRPMARL